MIGKGDELFGDITKIFGEMRARTKSKQETDLHTKKMEELDLKIGKLKKENAGQLTNKKTTAWGIVGSIKFKNKRIFLSDPFSKTFL